MKLKIDNNAKKIIARFKEKGYEAFVVGGCVRDTLMGRTPNDWDIATNALPGVSLELFDHTIPTGLKHGTVTVMMDKTAYEITTYRIDGEYVDMRHPSEVSFSENILDDLSRRDFTINAMAYNDDDGLIDQFGGQVDIENRMIRCVGEADKRFNEDALRMIRAFRFSAKLGFEIEKNTLDSIMRNANNIKQVSIERINKELEETIRFNPEVLEYFNTAKISDWLFEDYILKIDDLKKAKSVEAADEMSMSIKRAFVFKGLDNERLKGILKKLRYSNKEQKNTLEIHRILTEQKYDKIIELNKNIAEKNRKEDIINLNILIKTILYETGDINLARASIESKFIDQKTNNNTCFRLFNDIIEEGQCFSVSQLDLNGRDIIENNLAKGPRIGELLNEICNHVIKNPHWNTKSTLLKLAKDLTEE